MLFPFLTADLLSNYQGLYPHRITYSNIRQKSQKDSKCKFQTETLAKFPIYFDISLSVTVANGPKFYLVTGIKGTKLKLNLKGLAGRIFFKCGQAIEG
jgi:hypothetical protein